MASAVRPQLGNRRWLVRLLAVTLACGFVFLGVKGIEYKDKWEEGLLTGGAIIRGPAAGSDRAAEHKAATAAALCEAASGACD